MTDGLDVLEETRAFNAELRDLMPTLPRLETVPPEESRASRREGRGLFPAPVFLEQARWETAPGRAGDVRMRVLEPPGKSRGVYLHIHGGGWVLGAADMQDVPLWELVEKVGVTAISVEYRLAPEHPWPAGADDCEDAALAVLERRDGPIVIGGESAGAHLAAVTLLRLRDRHGVDLRARFVGANLVFGVFDLAGTPSRLAWDDDLVLSPTSMDWIDGCVLPAADTDARRDPGVSPLYADLRDLPPALFTVGTSDPLLDDSLFMAARWRAAGNEGELRVWAEGAHGFTAFPIEIGRRSRAEQHAFVAEAVR